MSRIGYCTTASAEKAKQKAEFEETLYFSLDETNSIVVKVASSPSPCTSSILDHTSHIQPSSDDFDIDIDINKAIQAMGALNQTLMLQQQNNYYTKQPNSLSPKPFRSIYSYGWGCERPEGKHYIKLESFLQRSILNMTQGSGTLGLSDVRPRGGKTGGRWRRERRRRRDLPACHTRLGEMKQSR